MRTAVFLVVLLLLLGLSVSAEPCSDNSASIPLTIAHMNDIHAHYSPASLLFGECSPLEDDSSCFGGVARMKTAIQSIKESASKGKGDVLVLHAGDQFTGTTWDYVYTRNNEQVAPTFLNNLGIDAYTLGNHDFDYTSEVLASFIGNLSMPVLACNVDFSNEPVLDGLTERYAIIGLPQSGIKVGIVGLVPLDTPITSNASENIAFLEYPAALQECVQEAKADGAEIIIGLTHIGYDNDKVLATLEEARDVDVIVGGHSHSFLSNSTSEELVLVEPPTEESAVISGIYPTLVENINAKTIPIVQSYYGGRYIGKLIMSVCREGKGDETYSQIYISPESAPILLGGTNSTNMITPNKRVERTLNQLYAPIADEFSEVVGSTDMDLDGSRIVMNTQETIIADILADSFVSSAKRDDLETICKEMPCVAFLNPGAIRSGIEAGNITLGNCQSVLPFTDALEAYQINGTTMLEMIRHGVTKVSGLPQISEGTSYSFVTRNETGNKELVKAFVTNELSGEQYDLQTYDGSMILLLTNYLARGGGGFPAQEGPLLWQGGSSPDRILCDYLEQISPIGETTIQSKRIINCDIEEGNEMCTESIQVGPKLSGTMGPSTGAGTRNVNLIPSLIVLTTLIFGMDIG